jgi:hypothetical protein
MSAWVKPTSYGGGIKWPTSYQLGLIDEIHVSSVARDAQWMQTEYNNQSSPATFYALGPEDTGQAPSISSVADQTFTVGDPATLISTITITDDAVTKSIKKKKDLRIRIPSSFNMTWDTGITTVTLGGRQPGAGGQRR